MKLKKEFIQLPFKFDAERLLAEANALDTGDWMPHPQAFKGNYSMPLVSVNGEMNDTFNGAMENTAFLERSPYMQQVIASFDEVVGRSRLMRLDGGSIIPKHADTNYHWYNRVRIHIPIVTNERVTFYCGDKQQQMKAGECWLLDTWQEHWVENLAMETRIHLVIDTAGSTKFWDLVDRAITHQQQPNFISYDETANREIAKEKFNGPLVMSPGEVDALSLDILNDAKSNPENNAQAIALFEKLINEFRWEWRRVWSLHGHQESGWPEYEALINGVQRPQQPVFLASNNQPGYRTFLARVLGSALNKQVAALYGIETEEQFISNY